MTTARYPYVHVDVAATDAEVVGMELWELGAGGVEERDKTTMTAPDGEQGVTLVASFADESVAQDAIRSLGERHHARLIFVVGDDWRDAWREHFKPSRVSRRLIVRPPWEEVEPQPEDVVITVDPGQAFGTGTHETTRLVLREIDRRVVGGESVLDVGAGSGILAIGALLLGARRALAIDIDAEAVRACRANALANRVSSRLGASLTAVDKLRSAYDVVLANIEAGPLISLADALVGRIAAGGLLVLSGVLRDQRDAVVKAYTDRGLCHALTSVDGEWVGIVMRPRFGVASD